MEEYKFILCDPNDYTVQEAITIDDLASGCMFCAKDLDGKYIKDNRGNNIFKALSGPRANVCGPYVYCISIGRTVDA